MAINVGTLSAFVKEDTREPLSKALYSELGKMQTECNVYPGIKSSVKLPLIDDTVIFQTGTGCNAINPSGDTVISQKQLSPGKVEVDKDWCPETLEPYFTQAWLKEGAMYKDESSLPQWLLQYFLKILKDKLITRDWFATTANDKYTGLGTNIDTTGGYVTATAQASVTSSNIIGIFDDIASKIPGRVRSKTDLRLYIGEEDYQLACTAYKNANLFNYGTWDAAVKDGEFIAPGTNFKVTRDPGLSAAQNGQHKMYLISSSNIWMGMDGTNDDEVVDLWYEKKDAKIYARCKFRRTFDVAYVTEVVRYANY